jgi:hypothetical protein
MFSQLERRQAGQEVEELRRRHVKALCITPRDAG